MVRQGPGRRPRRRRAQARQRLRRVAARRRARRRRRRPRLRLVVDAAPERHGDAVVAHAGASRRPTSPSTSSSACTAGRCRASRATGSASPRCRKWSRAARPSTSTETNARVAAWQDGAAVEARDRLRAARRRPALPLARPAVAEDRGSACTPSSTRCARSRSVNAIDRDIVVAPRGHGRHRHLRQGALRPAGGVPPPRHLARRARRRRRAHLQGRPGVSGRADAHRTRSREGLDEILVVEEKGAGRRDSSCATCSTTAPVRPAIVGKRDAQGRPLVSELGELRPSRLIEIVADWLAARFPQLDRRHLVRDFTVAASCSRTTATRSSACPTSAPAARTTPRPRCPRARARRPASAATSWPSWMDRDTEGLIQMGGEGVDWVSHAMFTKVPHVFQNLGDGTYYHSGYLAIRQAIAAKDQHHLQDPVQRRGGDDRRPAGRRHRSRSTRIARQVEAEGATQGRRAVATTSPSTTRSTRPFPGRHRVPRPRASSTRCSAACARCRA